MTDEYPKRKSTPFWEQPYISGSSGDADAAPSDLASAESGEQVTEGAQDAQNEASDDGEQDPEQPGAHEDDEQPGA